MTLPNAMGAQHGKRSAGTWSLILAVLAFVIAVVSFMTALLTPKDASDTAGNVSTAVFIGGFLLAAPIMHIAGFVLGIVAVFRHGDRRALGVLGLVLNSIAVAAIVGIVWIGLIALGSFT